MSTDRDTTRIVRSWLDEGVTVIPDRVLDAVLDQVPSTPQRRPIWPVQRFLHLNTYARFGLVAAAVVLAAVVGIGLFGKSVGGPSSSPNPSSMASPSALPTPLPDPMVGTWLAAEVTCAQQNAKIKAAGFSAQQVTLGGWKCPNGTTNRYSFRIEGQEPRSLRVFDKGVLAFPGFYRFVDSSTFTVTPLGSDYCLTYRYAIVGDQLTIGMIGHGCPTTGEAPLNDQIAQTAIFETSPFTRQP